MKNAAYEYHKKKDPVSKVSKYKWLKNGEPGNLCYIPKNDIFVDETYQRAALNYKVLEIASAWDWVACGTITVGQRSDGSYVCIDGQHRLCAALRRSDIDLMPCNVFQMESIADEARSFVASNTLRKPVNSVDKFRASVTAGDHLCIEIQGLIKSLGLKFGHHDDSIDNFRSIEWCIRHGSDDYATMAEVLITARELSIKANHPIHKMLLCGLHYINKHVASITKNAKLRELIFKVGARRLMDGASREKALTCKTGDRVCAAGMLREINHGRREENHFKIPA